MACLDPTERGRLVTTGDLVELVLCRVAGLLVRVLVPAPATLALRNGVLKKGVKNGVRVAFPDLESEPDPIIVLSYQLYRADQLKSRLENLIIFERLRNPAENYGAAREEQANQTPSQLGRKPLPSCNRKPFAALVNQGRCPQDL